MGWVHLPLAALERLDQGGFVLGNMLADKHQRGRLLRKRFELPAPSDIIEQIGAFWETDEALGAHDRRVQILDNLLKTLPCQRARGNVAEGLQAGKVTILRWANLMGA